MFFMLVTTHITGLPPATLNFRFGPDGDSGAWFFYGFYYQYAES